MTTPESQGSARTDTTAGDFITMQTHIHKSTQHTKYANHYIMSLNLGLSECTYMYVHLAKMTTNFLPPTDHRNKRGCANINFKMNRWQGLTFKYQQLSCPVLDNNPLESCVYSACTHRAARSRNSRQIDRSIDREIYT